MKHMYEPCGDFQLSGCRFEDGLLVVSMRNEIGERELRLKPVSFSCPK